MVRRKPYARGKRRKAYAGEEMRSIRVAARSKEQKRMIEVYVEKGQKRTFAGALDWPGWTRSGSDEAAALQALLDYGPRYAGVLRGTPLRFRAPRTVRDLKVVEKLKGGAGTNEGWPQAYPLADSAEMTEADIQRAGEMLQACWRKLDEVVKASQGRALRKDSDGRGRDLEKVLRHVLQGHSLYLSELGAKPSPATDGLPRARLRAIRPVTLQALRKAARGKLGSTRPRGGSWSPRYFVRRAAWHILDHAWEIEDRIE